MGFAREVSDRVLFMDDGVILEDRKLSPSSVFDFLDLEKDGKQAVYPMRLRMVRFLLDTGGYECIVTNLEREAFPPWRIRELYHLRWGIETSFRKLKYSLGLSQLHSKRRDT
ncbi:MAG: transposase [Blautia sp.]